MTASPWWSDERALARFVGDLIAHEFTRLRPGAPGPALPAAPWPATFNLGDGGLGADSLDRLGLAAALSEALNLHRSGLEDMLLARGTLGDWLAVCRAALARYDDAITFRTSGSTAAAKSCNHSLDTLYEEAATLAALLPGRQRVLSAVPAHHTYGFLFTILLPARLTTGNPMPVLDLRSTSPAALPALCQPGDLVVGHPAFWQAVVRSGATLPADVAGISSTAPCPADLAESIRGCGLARFVEVYGSTETAGVGWRDDPHGPFRLVPHWSRDGAALVRRLPPGMNLTADVQDHLDWIAPDRFQPAGRIDHVVQVGGANVSPARVRMRRLDHLLVADAAVRLMNPDEGTRLKAFVVPADGSPGDALLHRELAVWIDRTLPPAERPRALTFGPRLPSGPLGKPADWPILTSPETV
jgi:long-chain acyl-CoA synthetase